MQPLRNPASAVRARQPLAPAPYRSALGVASLLRRLRSPWRSRLRLRLGAGLGVAGALGALFPPGSSLAGLAGLGAGAAIPAAVAAVGAGLASGTAGVVTATSAGGAAVVSSPLPLPLTGDAGAAAGGASPPPSGPPLGARPEDSRTACGVMAGWASTPRVERARGRPNVSESRLCVGLRGTARTRPRTFSNGHGRRRLHAARLSCGRCLQTSGVQRPTPKRGDARASAAGHPRAASTDRTRARARSTSVPSVRGCSVGRTASHLLGTAAAHGHGGVRTGVWRIHWQVSTSSSPTRPLAARRRGGQARHVGPLRPELAGAVVAVSSGALSHFQGCPVRRRRCSAAARNRWSRLGRWHYRGRVCRSTIHRGCRSIFSLPTAVRPCRACCAGLAAGRSAG